LAHSIGAILRELQVPRPLQVLAPNREMEAYVRALMKSQRAGTTDAEDKTEMAGVVAAVVDSLTERSNK
jgi:hypothetical protein